MKRFLSVFFTLTMLSSAPVYAQADYNKVSVNVDGVEMDFDVEPVLENGRVLVPFRAVFEKLGCNVSYSDTDGRRYVTAIRGDESIILEINSKDMYVNGNTQTLDVPAKIVDGRILVPLRAVSESLDARVEWLGEINTVCIYPKHGLHRINSISNEKVIKSENGNVLMNISYVYPVIENPDSNAFIDNINKQYKQYVDSFVKESEEFTEDAKLLCEEMGKDYIPMEFSLSYKVNTDRKDILSITNYEYSNTGGAHPSSERISKTFDLKAEKELSLTDIINGNEDERQTMICDVFTAELENSFEGFDAEMAAAISEESENVKYYLTDDKLVLYFDVYQIGPYALGYPTVELSYTEGVFKLNWTEANLDALKFSLEGNPTTGYQWEVISYDPDMLSISSEYVADENEEGLVGVGGKYNFTVKGLKEGNCSIDLAYLKSGESTENAQDEVTYNLYVSKDGKITVLGKESDLSNIIYGE